MRVRVTLVASLGLLAWAVFLPASAQPPSAAEGVTLFDTQVRPILQAHCVRCHGGEKTRSGLALTTRQGLLKGGERGPAVSLDRPDDSLLLQVVNQHDELKMPPKRKLSSTQIDTLRRWVKISAPWTEGAIVKRLGPPRVDEQARSFWSFRPVVSPKVPVVKNPDWVKTPVDAFVLARLEAAKLAPAPPAGKTSLLRRVTYDLTGLLAPNLNEFIYLK